MTGWRLENFEECLDRWIDQDKPSGDLSLFVTGWLMSRLDDPYQGVLRADGFDNFWYGSVPGSEHGSYEVVVCSYFIEEDSRTVRCASIATLSRPL